VAAVKPPQAGEHDVDSHAQRRAHAKGRASHGNKVDEISQQSVHDVADEGVEGDPQRHWHVPAEGNKGQEKGNQDVAAPRVETPAV
jgi:hypothetical protein